MRKLGDWLGRATDRDSPDAPAAPGETEMGSAVTAEPGESAAPAQVEQVFAALREIYDPEIPVNIYDLGLIYRVDIDHEGAVSVDMTLTAPGCPVAQEFPGMVEAEVCRVPGVTRAHVEIVWDPPWTPDRMSDEAKLELGML